MDKSVASSVEAIPADAVEVVESVADEVFSFLPKPGGMVERHRAEKARREAAAEEAKNESQPVYERAAKAVKVMVVSPEIITTNQIVIPAGGVVAALPFNSQRARAVIYNSSAAANAVILASSQGNALAGIGVGVGQFSSFTVQGRGMVWAFAANPVTLVVYAELYSPE
jgi:hypothetical protein